MPSHDSARPRVSILIPNFNNGAAASVSGRRHFIVDLLTSLRETLADDPTPFEVIVHDDGSTDDGLAAVRRWAQEETWPDGRPFLTLKEFPHSGILSVVANRLSREARGEILVRLDGDTICLTPNWVSELCAVFDDGPPDLGVIAPKQLDLQGRIHALGDWVLHPRGYLHAGQGADRYAYTRSIEVDHAMGCFYCCRRSVYETLGCYDETILRGQTIDFGLRARQAGFRCWAAPHIEFIHAHLERHDRATEADTPEGIDRSLQTFEKKWGFSRIAPDLGVLRERYRGTPLLWNARIFGPQSRHHVEVTPETSEWGRFADDQSVAQSIHFRLKVIADVLSQVGSRSRIVHLACGDGLIGHLLAQRSAIYTGVEAHPGRVALARTMTAHNTYAAASPTYLNHDPASATSLQDGCAGLLLITGGLEQYWNPVGLLKEAHRLLAPEGVILLTAARRNGPSEYLMDLAGGYGFGQLVNQFMAVGLFHILVDPKKDAGNPEIILVGKRKPESAPALSKAA